MNKKERIRLAVGSAIMIIFLLAVASIGWTKEEFNVTYFYGFDGKFEVVRVKKGYIDPILPGRYGHVFDGWYYTDKTGEEYLFDPETERVTTDLELTAHWVPFETEFNLIEGEGECEFDSVFVPYGAEYTLPEAHRDGWYFAGWEGCALLSSFMYTSGVWNLPVDVFSVRARYTKFKPGTTYFLGRYEQDNVDYTPPERIEWIPIDKKDGKYLLVSKYSLDAMHMDDEPGRRFKRWADCSLRKWLNEEFYMTAFTEEERAMICPFTDAELGTTDNVFLLSLDEGRLLVGFDELGAGTKYALKRGLEKDANAYCGEYALWWTRSCHSERNWCTDGGGGGGGHGPYALQGVRPAIWVDADKLGQR